jgi:hypothetical protein
MLTLVLAFASACAAETVDLTTPDAGVADASAADASPPDAAAAPDAAPRRDGSIAPHCVPATRTVELTQVGRAIDVDFAPSADRVLVVDGVGTFHVFALPSGDRSATGVHGAGVATPRFTYDGRSVVLDVGGGELRLESLHGEPSSRLGTDYACDYLLTPDRRYLVALVACHELSPQQPVARLEVYDLELRAMVYSDEYVLGHSVVSTGPGVPEPMLAYLRDPRGTSCSRCPTFDGEVVEVSLSAPRAPPPSPIRFVTLYGYSLGGSTLIGGRGPCACEATDALGAWDARAERLLAAGTVYAGVRDTQLGTTPGVLGREGVAVVSGADERSVYAPYTGDAPRALDLQGGIPLSILSHDGTDSDLVAFDRQIQLVRMSLGHSGSPMLLGPESSPSVSAGASRDRERLAVAIESSEGTYTLQSGPASGELELNATSTERTTLVTVLPDGRGVLARMGPNHLALFRGTERLDLANDLLESGRVFVDEGTCWAAARREATDTVRVLPLP